MLKCFSTGIGSLSVVLSIIFVLGAVIFARQGRKTGKMVFSTLAAVCITYLIIGISLLFKPPYQETGTVYFPSNVSVDRIQDYFTKKNFNESTEPLNLLDPNAETYNTKQIVYKDGSLCTVNFKSAVYSDSRTEQVLYTYEDASRAEAAYTERKGTLREVFSEKYLTEKNGLIETEGEGYSVCIFPITYDGVCWLLPFADSDGTTLLILVRCENQCLEIRESSETGNLSLPENIFN